MYPTNITISHPATGLDIPVGYNFPKRFRIRFWDGKEEIHHKIRPAYLVAMSTTYNSGEATYFEDGRPTSVEVTLTFSEDRPLSREDIVKGY